MPFSKEKLDEILSKHVEWLAIGGGDPKSPAGDRADLQLCDLEHTDFSFEYLNDAIFKGSNLQGGNLKEANLHGANLFGANLFSASLTRTDLSGANLYGVDLQKAEIELCNFQSSNLTKANIQEVKIIDTNFKGASLRGAILNKSFINRANLQWADLRGAYCIGVVIQDSILKNINCVGACFRSANLIEADLSSAKLERSDFRGSNLEKANLNSATLKGAKLQETILKAADLQNADFQDADLKEANLQNANLRNANLQRAQLKAVDFQGAILRGAILKDAKLQGANMRGGDIRGFDLQGANIQRLNLQGANLKEANLQGANLQWANLEKANLQGVIFKEADLLGANLQESDLKEANLQCCNLQGINLKRADLQWSILWGAILRGANLQEANLTGAYLKNADLVGAFLMDAVLDGATLNNANLEGAEIQGCHAEQTDLKGIKLFAHQCKDLNQWIGKPKNRHLVSIRVKEGTMPKPEYVLWVLFKNIPQSPEFLRALMDLSPGSWSVNSLFFDGDAVFQLELYNRKIKKLFATMAQLQSTIDGVSPVLSNLPELIGKYTLTMDNQEKAFQELIVHQDETIRGFAEILKEFKDNGFERLEKLVKSIDEKEVELSATQIAELCGMLRSAMTPEIVKPGFMEKIRKFAEVLGLGATGSLVAAAAQGDVLTSTAILTGSAGLLIGLQSTIQHIIHEICEPDSDRSNLLDWDSNAE